MNIPQTDLLDAILRTDFLSFTGKVFATLNPGQTLLANWHHEVMAYYLEKVMRGEITRLIICLPPRSLKSQMASVAFPAFYQGHYPGRSVIGASYSADLASQFQNDQRRIMQSDWYRRAFPGAAIGSKNTQSQLHLKGGGRRFATSVGGTLTGRGADVIIIDDPVKASDAFSLTARQTVYDWYRTTVLSRLNDKRKGAIVIVAQRVHADDLVGRLLAEGGEWTVLELPAVLPEERNYALGSGRVHKARAGDILHPERESAQTLDRLRAELGSAAFSAQYLQRPEAPESALIKREWIQRYSASKRIDPDESYQIQSWDTAAKTAAENDYSVCTTWVEHRGLLYLLDVFRERLAYPDLRRKAHELATQYNPNIVLIEDSSVGQALIPELRQMGINVKAVRATQSKLVRASQQSAVFEAGRVSLPLTAPWLAGYEEEVLAFPNVRHDDQVDSTIQALAYATGPRAQTRTKYVRTI